MDQIIIDGGVPLSGSVTVQGSKNSALPILFATILTEDRCTINNVPELSDVRTTQAILEELGMHCDRDRHGAICVETTDPTRTLADYDLVSTMRASICTLGPLLARRGKAKVSLPGGCVFGAGGRPVDLHLKGLEALGARIKVEKGYIIAEGKLKGAALDLSGPRGSTVTGTANILMAATLAEGDTEIRNAALEPEVTDLAIFLRGMGAQIEGVGTSTLEVHGVKELHGTDHIVMPDRIEAGTLLLAGAITKGAVTVKNVVPKQLDKLAACLEQAGFELAIEEDSIAISTNGPIRAIDISTRAYPGFPTDLQAPMTALLTQAEGVSQISENIYQDRFQHIPELNRLGAGIDQDQDHATIDGPKELSGAPVMASDLRSGASLILAGLVAKGITTVKRIYHVDRGYEAIEKKLARLGACIRREKAVAKAEETVPEPTRIPVHQD
ncbi:MAG: UDP-N-acetylglucosamine 1-carboxyvinyltransferase [Planctomycetota bacterium]|nr:UDP-N-acetylglucosamine 1-carboxyvinyltransferase [Planctomycetota bacterium]MEC9030599.1 UDP-N-acetylglucosamine 1-carboxyvinyltransferase [Planctomycetota bacterium]MEE3296902.1 UDP-N-acetylglucosamine 1-carboxyvinyltransferase [Planctomycetota bacterium]